MRYNQHRNSINNKIHSTRLLPHWLQKLYRQDPTIISFIFLILLVEVFILEPPSSFLDKKQVLLVDKSAKPIIFHSINVKNRRLNTPSALDYSKYPGHTPKLIIATIILGNHQSDIDKLCRALSTLHYLKGDVENFPTPLLIFNDGTLSNFQLEKLVQSTTRPIAFPLVELSEIPLNTTESKSQYYYSHKTQFWIHDLYFHAAVAPFDYIMHFDYDTCFNAPNEYLPNFEKLHKVHHAQYVGTLSATSTNNINITQLYKFTNDYMKVHDILPTNPLLWHYIQNTFQLKQSLPVFQSSLEVIRKTFMQHDDVVKFTHAVVSSKNILNKGWNEHVLKFIIAALFAPNEKIMTNGFHGFLNRESCIEYSQREEKQLSNRESNDAKVEEEITKV